MKHLQQTIISLMLACLIVAPAQAATQMYFIHNDHLGTPQVVTDQSQAVVWQGHQTPFGVVEETTATVEQLSRFPGQYFDEESGLSYNYFRDYDPSLGRYIQSDPIGILSDYSDPQMQVAISMGMFDPSDYESALYNHSYGYVDQNPIGWIDPVGLSKTKGVTRGNDPILNDYKKAAESGDRSRIDQVNKDAKSGKYGELSKDRAKKNKAWYKLAKDGRLLKFIPPTVFGICLDTYRCWCIQNPVACGECGI